MKKNSILVLILLSGFFANAQNNNGGFVTYSKASKGRSAAGEGDFMQLIKLCPLWMLEGNIPLFYERKLGGKVSVEVSAGVTFNNYSYDLFNSASSTPNVSQYESSRYYQPGYSLSGGFKYYPSEALVGFYVGPEVRYRNYVSQAPINDQGSAILGTPSTNPSNYLQESLSFTDFKMVFGYVAYIEDVMPIEFFGGLGIREISGSRVYDNGNNNGNNTLQSISASGPLLSVGMKIGVGLR